MYLYIFEDQVTAKSEEPPTDEDNACIRAGILTVIDLSTMNQLDGEGGGTEVMDAVLESFERDERTIEYQTYKREDEG